MHLGLEFDAHHVRSCLASTVLGAEPGSWADYNHRCGVIPSWIVIRLKDGAYGPDPEEILIGEKAIQAATGHEFRSELDSGRSVVWPWFLRNPGEDPGTFTGVLRHYWASVLNDTLAQHARCRRVTVAVSPARLPRVRAALDPRDEVEIVVLPDYFCAWRACPQLSSLSERAVYVDPGDDAFRLTRFRVEREQEEYRVYMEDFAEVPELGALSVLGQPIREESGTRIEWTGLAGWHELESRVAKLRDSSDCSDPALARVRAEMVRQVRRFSSDVAARIDRTLVKDGLLWGGEGLSEPFIALGTHGVAKGAALVGQRHSERAHFVFPGGLYLAVDGNQGTPLVSSEELLKLGPSGRTFVREDPRGTAQEISLALLWGFGGEDGGFLPVVRLSSRLGAPTPFTVVGVTVHREGLRVDGSLWLAEPDAASLPEVGWKVDLSEWAFWSAR